MDAASGVAGLVSLGLTVCQGLITYYQSWSSQEKHITGILQRLDDLQQTVELLHGKISQLSANDLAATGDHINLLANRLNTSINSLSVILVTCNTNKIPAGIKEKIRAIKQRAIYPFKKQTIDELNRNIDSLLESLRLGVDLLKLNISGELLNRNDSIIYNLENLHTISYQTQSSTAIISRQMSLLSESVVAMQEEISIQSAAQSAAQVALLQRIEAIKATIGQHASQLIPSSSQSQSTPHHQIVREERRFIQRIVEKPSLQRELCDKAFAEPLSREAYCTCIRSRQKTWAKRQQVQWGPTGLFRQEENTSHHSKDCLFFKRSRSASYGVTLNTWKWLLARTVDLGFCLQSGAGGYSIGIKLNVRSIYRPNSPALLLLGQYISVEKSIDCRKVLISLQQLYQSGKASPYDVDSSGRNALHYCTFVALKILRESAVEMVLCLASGLTAAGVPVEEDCWGYTPLYVLAHQLQAQPLPLITILKEAVSLGWDNFGNTEWSAYYTYGILELYYHFTDDIYELEVGPLCRAVLSRSEEEVAAALHKWPQALLHERTKLGYNAIHLAANWPGGLKSLLDWDAISADDLFDLVNGESNYNLSPLDLAAETCSFESFRLLVGAGSVILNINRLSQQTSFANKVALSAALKGQGDALSALGQKCLPPHVWAGLHVRMNRTLDAQADDVIPALYKHDIIAVFGSSFHQNVYCHKFVDRETAQLLWIHGFVDIDVLDYRGFVPLVSQCLSWQCRLDVVEWLLSRGAPFVVPPYHYLDDAYPSTVTREHYIAWAMARSYRVGDAPIMRRLQFTLQSNSQDCCRCICSSHGCTPLILFVRETLSLPNLEPQVDTMFNFLRNETLELLHQAAPDIIRVVTVYALELTHTCCHSPFSDQPLCPRYKNIDVDEIRDEERLLIHQANHLIEEFVDQYWSLGLSLPHFFYGYWRKRILQELSIPKKYDEEDLKNLREVGVRGLTTGGFRCELLMPDLTDQVSDVCDDDTDSDDSSETTHPVWQIPCYKLDKRPCYKLHKILAIFNPSKINWSARRRASMSDLTSPRKITHFKRRRLSVDFSTLGNDTDAKTRH